MKNSKGTIFITVIVISALMIFIIVAVSNMILQDTHMVKRLRYSTQAQYLAESGISDALATLATSGASGFEEVSPGTTTNLGDGTYRFTVKKYTVGSKDRWLVSSEGIVNSVSRIVTVEVKDVSSPTMNNALSAGTNITIKSNNGDVTITGDIHANNDLWLKEQGAALNVVAPVPPGDATGKATSSNGYKIQGTVSIADEANSGGGKPRLSMPIFNFAHFADVAENYGGNYIDGDADFEDNLNIDGGDAGITYVNGNVTFTGTCKIIGGFVAKGNITLNNDNYLTQTHDTDNDPGNRFPIFMSEQGARMKLFGQFSTAEDNIVYATNDIQIETPGLGTTIAGTVIAGGSFTITANNDLTIRYGEITSYEAVPLVVRIVSWNK